MSKTNLENEQSKQGVEQGRQGRVQAVQGISNAVVAEKLDNLVCNFDEFKTEIRATLIPMTIDVNNLKVDMAIQKQRISNFSVFGLGFSIFIGAIAGYLGYKK